MRLSEGPAATRTADDPTQALCARPAPAWRVLGHSDGDRLVVVPVSNQLTELAYQFDQLGRDYQADGGSWSLALAGEMARAAAQLRLVRALVHADPETWLQAALLWRTAARNLITTILETR